MRAPSSSSSPDGGAADGGPAVECEFHGFSFTGPCTMNLATSPSADRAPVPLATRLDRQERQPVSREGHPGGHDAGR